MTRFFHRTCLAGYIFTTFVPASTGNDWLRYRPGPRWRPGYPVTRANWHRRRLTLGPMDPAAKVIRLQFMRVWPDLFSWLVQACPNRGRRRPRQWPSRTGPASISRASKARCTKVLVDDGFNADQMAFLSSSDTYMVGMPPPPAQMTTVPLCSNSHLIGRMLEDPLR